MVQITWTFSAKEDLIQIFEYISKDSKAYAINQINRIYNKTEILIELPLARKILIEANDKTIREIIEGNYRIIYHISTSDVIEILAVHHGARNLSSRKII